MSIGPLGVPVRNLPGTMLLPDLHEAPIAHGKREAAAQLPGARRALPLLNRAGLATQAWRRRAPEACALMVAWLECHRKQATAELSRGNTPARPAVSRASNRKLPRFVYRPAEEPVPCKPMRSPTGKCLTRRPISPPSTWISSPAAFKFHRRPQMPFVIGRVQKVQY